MRIIVSYFFSDDSIPYGWAVTEALERMGHEVRRFDSTVEHPLFRTVVKPFDSVGAKFGASRGWLEKRTPYGREEYKRRRLEELVASFRPEVILVIRSNAFIVPEFAQELRQRYEVRCLIGWRVDGPGQTTDIDLDADAYDLYYCIHRYGYRNSRIKHLPMVAVDAKRYHLSCHSEPARFRHDVVFVGGWNSRRQEFVPALKKSRVAIYGKWQRAGRGDKALRSLVIAKNLWGNELRETYNRSKIGLSILGWDPALDPCCNLRTFDVPACGALLLSEYSAELRDYFNIGREIDTFRSGEEMVDKISYYLSNERVRSEVARRGWERTAQLPTVQDRVAAIVRDYESNRWAKERA